MTIDARLDPGRTSGEPVLLERCVVKLVENAVKHNIPEGTVTVRTGTTDHWAWIRVANTGPALTPDQAESIFEPFTRPSRTHGAGLGLSIVRAVTTAHGGLLDAAPRPGGGMTVTIQLPSPVQATDDQVLTAGYSGTSTKDVPSA